MDNLETVSLARTDSGILINDGFFLIQKRISINIENQDS